MPRFGGNYVDSDESDDDADYITVQEWEKFVAYLDLENIWLYASTIDNHYSIQAPIKVTLEIQDDAEWDNHDDGFQVIQSFTVEFFGYQLGNLARIEVKFGLKYLSSIEMNDLLWEYFDANILPLHSWPYLREYVSSTAARMNWLPLTIPTHKIYRRSKKATEEEASKGVADEKYRHTDDDDPDQDDMPF